MIKNLDKIYNPQDVETKIYGFWTENRYFHAAPDKSKTPYTIAMPPPNITGQLHIGHAMDCTLQDIIIRFKRMQGYAALWLPGSDHAAIATELKIVEAMRSEGLTKEDLGREKFLERAWQWKEEYGGRIIRQLRRMGSSCDWERERFTMDEGCSRAVKEVFVRLYEKGLIYRGERIVNWCPVCKTSISDAEVEFDEKDGHFWHIRYPLKDGGGFIEIATTRPETMLGDTAVAVHPGDVRYKNLIGKTLLLPLVNREIPVVADEYVEMDFGTGAVKITPAHDPNDFEVGRRHGLPAINIMSEDAAINENGGVYSGLDRYDARKKIVEDLEAGGFLVSVREHAHNVGSCYRCGNIIEPRLSTQWFVSMKPLAEPAVQAVRDGETQLVPARFEKIYFNWMENIRDWCISRQLWWGHRIPAYYCGDCGGLNVSRDIPEVCPKCGSHNIKQDEDTLDTWFSSALWPFSTLGWPDETEDLKYFYPTDTLVTAYDIIFFWVARMIFSGIEHTGRTPFKHVLLHGLVRDARGRKMSKSLNNGVDPLEVIDKYGADALRFTLTFGNSPGNDMRFSEEKILSSRNFTNKLWNAARFVLMNLDEDFQPGLPEELTIEDKWAISIINRLNREIAENLDRFEFGVALQKIYDYTWDIFCDWYIELSKPRLQGEQAGNVRRVLVCLLTNILKLLHPFIPFVTEEIYSAVPHAEESLITSAWPEYTPALDFSKEEKEFGLVIGAIRGIRNRRAEMNIPTGKKASVIIETEFAEIFSGAKAFFERLASASSVEITDRANAEGAVAVVSAGARVFIPMGELVDTEKELARLGKEKRACEKDISFFSAKLNNPAFVEKAPARVIETERAKLSAAEERLKKIEESIKAFAKN
ncbi:MAG: valine--tRNA ligase [Oscillospiraceae bacterium]|jgi:valyl-tRNA synthetase|nr:valine--tRNA ligase [Oscillospiraceae bacterium]